MTTTRPTLNLDLFSDDAIRDPYPHYRTIRDRAPVVWLERHEVWAIGRYQEARDALRADEVLISGQGVALNDLVNSQPGRATLTSDGELHRKRRRVLMKPMMPRALAEVRTHIDELANNLVTDLVARESFDGIVDFAQHLPVSVVSHLVGLPEEGRERMLDWARGTFNALGPMNERAQAATPAILEMINYAAHIDRSRLRPDGWAARVFEAVDEGQLDPEDARGLLIDYVAPSLDTTLLGTGHLLYLLGTHPEQYELVRSDPELVPSAVDEALRLGSPVRGFTRLAVKPYEAGEVSIAQGERALILYGAANRDERHYTDADCFDVTRNASDHVAFGYGVHRCAGGYLALLEMQSLLRAMTTRVKEIEVGAPTMLMSNMLHGFESFRASFR